MREHSRDRGRLEDIVKYAQNVNVIISGISYDEFTKDIRIYYSVILTSAALFTRKNASICVKNTCRYLRMSDFSLIFVRAKRQRIKICTYDCKSTNKK